jgi:hypothetical protein
MVVFPTPAIIRMTDDGSQSAESAYRTENAKVVLGVPDPGAAVPAVSVVWRFDAPLQLAASTGSALKPSPRAARTIARAMTGALPRAPTRLLRK